jgi:hypothetical protein
MTTDGQRNGLTFFANLPKAEKYPIPWEGFEPVTCGAKCMWYEREAACLQPGECRSHSLVFFISGSVILHVGARTLLSQACCWVTNKELHNILPHVETDDYLKALQSAWRYVAMWIYLWSGGCCFRPFFLSVPLYPCVRA